MVLTLDDYQEAAAILECDLPSIIAVARIESNGEPFIAEGYPTILFEGHVFWSELKKAGEDPAVLLAEHPDLENVLYRKWTKKYYRRGMGEYERLDKAASVNEGAALRSASWGAFQIMGFNCGQCGYDDVFSFVDDMKASVKYHLLAFCRFMQANNLVHYVNSHDWAGFARRYNGPGYAKNKYDTLLAQEYDRAKAKYA